MRSRPKDCSAAPVQLNPVSVEEPAAGASAADVSMDDGGPAVADAYLPEHEEAPEEEAVADVHQARAKRSPVVPSQEEVVRHELTHLPFRSWC